MVILEGLSSLLNLKVVDDNSQLQAVQYFISGPKGADSKNAFLDLLLVNRVDLVSKVQIGGHLGHSDYETIEFKISVDSRKNTNKTSVEESRLQACKDKDGHLTNRERDKVEVFNTFFASVFNTDDGPRVSQCSELEDHDCKNDPVNPEIVQDLLLQLDPYKSMGPDGSRILTELPDVIAKPVLMIFEWSWESREVLADWKLVNVVPVFKKGKKEDPGNYRPISLTSVPDLAQNLITKGLLRFMEPKDATIFLVSKQRSDAKVLSNIALSTRATVNGRNDRF
ncbi:hypothetical protein BTVI_37854 [Pitangus sulphuratus]|nr:hypothetical protein BTVI_37854 [Pitangus sulphuratus]